jgi:hypothetical protein
VAPSIAGATAQASREALERAVGAEVLARALSDVPADVRDEYASMTAVGWVRLSTTAAVLDAAARISGRDAEQLADEVTRLGTARAFRTVWRAFFRFVSDEAIVTRAPILYAKSRNVGSLSVTRFDPGLAELVLADWASASDRDLRVVGVAIRATLELLGRRDVRLAWERLGRGARYRLAWRRAN